MRIEPYSTLIDDDPHFNAWSQTCPLREWVRYEGPRWQGDVFMVERPKAEVDA